MEKYAKRLQDIINEQDFCFEPEEIRTVEKALGVLKKYEDADIPAEACVEYRKFEDELIRDGMSLQHVLDLLKAEKEGRLINVSDDLPRSFLLCSRGEEPPVVYLSQLSAATLLRRAENNSFE